MINLPKYVLPPRPPTKPCRVVPQQTILSPEDKRFLKSLLACWEEPIKEGLPTKYYNTL